MKLKELELRLGISVLRQIRLGRLVLLGEFSSLF